jgi:hypothetical protein
VKIVGACGQCAPAYCQVINPYSLDLVPSNFYLFGFVKRCLAGLSFEDEDQLLAAVEGVLEGIGKVTLQMIFLEWMNRFRKYITTNGSILGRLK